MRNSNFELLRLVSMFFIVFYHILCFVIVKVDDGIIYKAMWLPFHVAVICFVLISGYFHIKPSLRGIVKLIAPLVIFYLPLTIWELAHGVGSIKSLLLFSKSPYWFIRTYLCLFLVAPVLNAYLTSNSRRIYLLTVLGFVSIYMGTLHEPSLHDGKNLALFMFLYVLGDCLNINKAIFEKCSMGALVSIYLLLNTFLVSGYALYHESLFGRMIWAVSFPYRSPVLIANAVLLFMIFAKLDFKSKCVNWLSSSVFAVYVIHHQHYILYSVIAPVALWGDGLFSSSPLALLVYIGIITAAIMLACILADKIPPPLLKPVFQLADRVEMRLKETLRTHIRKL